MRLLPSVLALSALFTTPALATRSVGPATDPAQLCRQAILLAEREHRLPPALLHAIARVESGRPDPRTGAGVSWPWTINAQGQGRFYETKEDAIAAVRALQARGVTVIDVGCLQVNLHHHPRAFASLDEAFDPLRTRATRASSSRACTRTLRTGSGRRRTTIRKRPNSPRPTG